MSCESISSTGFKLKEEPPDEEDEDEHRDREQCFLTSMDDRTCAKKTESLKGMNWSARNHFPTVQLHDDAQVMSFILSGSFKTVWAPILGWTGPQRYSP